MEMSANCVLNFDVILTQKIMPPMRKSCILLRTQIELGGQLTSDSTTSVCDVFSVLRN